MSNYVDLHSHILHAIDDGPDTLNEAVSLGRAYVSAGFDTVVATPHATEGRPKPGLILERLAELQGELKRLRIPLTLLPGAEQHIEPLTLKRLQNGELLTLNNTRYLLLELPFFQPLPPYALTLIADIATAGYIPVIPHPERAVSLQQNPQLLFELHEAGALFQVTWGALSGKLGPAARRVADYMLSVNLTHFFATDAHRPTTRLIQLEKPLGILTEKKGADFAAVVLTERPRKLIENQKLDLPPATMSAPGKGSTYPANYRTPLITRLRRRIGR